MGENHGMLENHHGLQLLYLNDCKLKTIPRQEVSGLVNMKYMDFSLNQLSDFDVNITTMDQLSFVSLSYNRIELLTEHVTSHLDHLAAVTNITVDITSNPLLCQWNISSLKSMRWIQHSSVNFVEFRDLLCTHSTRRKVSLKDLSLDELYNHCFPFQVVLITATVLATIGLFAVILFSPWAR